jgi:hypothetical protein
VRGGEREVRVDDERTLEVGTRLVDGFVGPTLQRQRSHRLQVVAPGVDIVGVSAADERDLGPRQLGLELADDAARDRLLQVGRRLALALELARPQHAPAVGLDQLRRHAQPRTDRAHAALDEVAHTELPRDRGQPLVTAAEFERRCARDDEEARHARKLRDHVLDQAVDQEGHGRIFSAGVERQHGDRRPVGWPHHAGLAGNSGGRGRNACRGWAVAHRHREPIPPPRHSGDGIGAQQLAQRRHLHGEVVLLHHHAGPDEGQQLVLADDAVAVLDQRQQQVESARIERLGLAAVQQPALVGVDLELTDHAVPEQSTLPSP